MLKNNKKNSLHVSLKCRCDGKKSVSKLAAKNWNYFVFLFPLRLACGVCANAHRFEFSHASSRALQSVFGCLPSTHSAQNIQKIYINFVWPLRARTSTARVTRSCPFVQLINQRSRCVAAVVLTMFVRFVNDRISSICRRIHEAGFARTNSLCASCVKFHVLWWRAMPSPAVVILIGLCCESSSRD